MHKPFLVYVYLISRYTPSHIHCYQYKTGSDGLRELTEHTGREACKTKTALQLLLRMI